MLKSFELLGALPPDPQYSNGQYVVVIMQKHPSLFHYLGVLNVCIGVGKCM